MDIEVYQNSLDLPAAAGGGIRDTVAMSLPPRRFRRRFSAYLLACAWLLAAPLASAGEAPPVSGATTAAALTAQIDAQIGQPRFAQASWGISVVSLDSGRTLYTHRADQLLQPASTAKLFTAALSMNTLGADYRIPTRVLASGDIRHGRLNGPLILYGMGDPTLGTATSVDWADQLASQLVARGVRSVKGDLIADDGYFAGPSFGSGWEAGDLQSWFAVPSSALSVQENIVDLTVDPGTTAGLPARLSFDPVDAKPSLLGQLTTTLPRTQSDINLYRAPGESTLYVFGTIPANTPSQHFKLAVPDPALLAGAQLQQALAHHGINVSGKLQAMHWPHDDTALLAHADTLAEVLSPPLLDILQSGLKRSQNLYLQNLLLSVGAHEQAALASLTPGQFTSTEQWGIKALQPLLAQIGIPPSASMITEGTGLSRRDLATPDALVHLLGYLAAQPYAAPLYEALPIAGVDGTLIGRMRHTAAENNVHAKTGSMEYVHCLVGYVTTAAGERLAFAIMLNNYEPPADGPRATSDVDAIAVLLASFRGRG
jgi:serine-type D-Ala-D-Ala carboxypeptidase/endopeptidase (penicillin-binding protein 4)